MSICTRGEVSRTIWPSYRPSFRSRWYVSLFGAIACLWLMFEMSAPYATLAIVCMLGIYALLARFNPERRGLSNMFQGAVFQFSRQLQIVAQLTIRSGLGE